MSVALTINGSTYEYPETGDQEWGPDATDWAVAVTSGMLQKAGGLFQLLADADFGTAFGLKSLYYKSRTANVATAGSIRLAVSDTINFRNNANNANLPLGINGSNQLTFDGVALALSPFSVSDTDSIDLTLNVNDISADLNLSSDPADPSNQLVTLSIESDGLKGQITNAAITSAVPIADGSTTGLLSNTDWTTFNGKQSTISISGAAAGAGNINAVVTLVANVLRTQVPILVGDSGSGGTAGVVPAPASGDASANKFLAADGTWKQSGSAIRTINAQTGVSYTFQLTDGSGNGNNPLVTLTNAADITATVPANATVAFPIGTQIDVIRGGLGAVNFEAAVGVTINGSTGSTGINIRYRYNMASLIKTGTNTWDLCGDVMGFIIATGGTITTDGNYKVHTFTSSGTFRILDGSGVVDSLVVGGGGGSSGVYSGGGGGGGLIYTSPGSSYGAGAYTVVVGAGGAANTSGSNSSFDSITATGGGKGGANSANGANGGSGGGGGAGGAGGTGTVGQGNNGGGGTASGNTAASGGGGAGAVGASVNGGSNNGGNGGAGVSNSISGSAVTYAGGGGGCADVGTPGTGGSGGGGNGASNAGTPTAGTANTGGGAGGGGAVGVAGGSGVVILRYRFQ